MKRNTIHVLCNWPSCPCHADVVRWRDVLDRLIAEPSPPEEIINEVMPCIYVTLKCMEHNCRDHKVRWEATKELMHPVWENLPDYMVNRRNS